MTTSPKMVSLPGFIFCLILLKTCLGIDSNSPTDSPADILECPGRCVEESSCTTSLNETDCTNGLVCCVDNLDRIESTEFADWGSTTEPTYLTTEVESEEVEVEVEDHDPETDGYTYVEESELDEDQRYELVYPQSDSNEVSADDGISAENCPGTCVPVEYTYGCDYIGQSENEVCPTGTHCCLSESNLQERDVETDEDSDKSRVLAKRESEFPPTDGVCPGTCVHPSHLLFCDEILPQYPCPLTAKCCIKRSKERTMPLSVSMECKGQCIPVNMYGYCFPPNELVLGPTTCARGTICCMTRPSDSGNTRPPTVNRMKFPGLPLRRPKPDPTQLLQGQVLGHLAVDDAGNVYRVSTNGKVSPLPVLTPLDHTRSQYTKLTAYPRSDGDIAIYSDSIGNLFQQFYPRQQNPLVRQPVYQFESQVSQHAAGFQKPTKSNEDSIGEVLEDIVIPDEEDEGPTSTTNPPIVPEKTPTPPCPGSCMSYFLRFTCFRGYAIYDGFTCPGRSVCCARLKDIEDHEQYLKSLSPYFNAPPSSRDDGVHRCGIKGRRDAPRVIGGKESLPGEWCWQVAIINVQNQYICGGTLIDNSWVLTAAHCVAGPVNDNQALFVRVGVTDLKSTEENNRGQTVRVLSTFVHHNFNNVNLDNNIALLRLQKPVELGSNVCVICLPTRGQMPKEDSKCTVTGYGFVSLDGEMSLKIREAEVPIIDDTDCMTNITEALTNPFILPLSSFCAGGHGQKDACQGDAGGPLVCEVGGYHELVGLVSWGLGCGRNDVPSIYVKVPAFMGWINQIISSSSFLMSLN